MISREVITTGATTDEAIEKGCEELGLTRDEVKVEILELPKQKTFGLFGGSPAQVRVYVERDPAVEAKKYLESIIKAMGLDSVDIEIKYNEDGSGAELEITGQDLGNIIGRHGETLAALQYLVSLSAKNVGEEYYRITVNVGNYREKHENSLENLARKTALRALKMNNNLALEAMNPYERRIIHTAVQEIEGASSWSVGEGAARHVVIGPEGLREGEDGLPVNKSRGYGRGYGGRGYNNRGYSGRNGYRGRRYNNNRGYQNGGRYGGYRNSYGQQDQEYSGDEQGSYVRQGRYGGNHNYSTGYDRYDRNSGYQRHGYGDREEGGEGGYDGNYRRNNGYRSNGGGYNRGGSRRNYNRNNSESRPSAEAREIRKDSSAPLYGRIEVKKTDSEDNDN